MTQAFDAHEITVETEIDASPNEVWRALVKSGSVTISSKGVPARFRSTMEWSIFLPPGASCRSLPASSSR